MSKSALKNENLANSVELDTSSIGKRAEKSSSNLSDEAEIGKFKLIAFFVIVALSVSLTYSNHFSNGFHLDDSHTIINNVYIQNIKNIPLFFKDGTTFSSLPSNQSYRPVVTTTLAIDYWLGNGLNPFYFHLSTFILFIVQGFLMFLLYLKIFNRSYLNKWNFIIAAFAVLWYLLHPANAETVNYIIARSDTLSTLFVVLAFVLYLYSPIFRRWHLYLIPVAIGALAKPPAMMFAPMLLVYDLCFEQKVDLAELFGKRGFARLKPALMTSLPAFILCGLMALFLQYMEPKTYSPGGTSRFYYLITQPYVILHYLKMFFLPVGLNVDTDWTTFNTVFDIHVLLGFASILFLIYLVFVTSREEKLRPISFGISWFLLALIPTSIIPLAEVLNYHRLFFPYVGLMIVVCWSAALVLMRIQKSFRPKEYFKPLVAAILLIVLAGYAFGTHQRNKVWKTDEALWYDATVKSPKSARGLMNYGLVLMARADYAGAQKYFYRALAFAPYYPYLHINIGILNDSMEQTTEAEKFFNNAIAYGSVYPDCYFFYARFLKKHNRMPEAIQNLNKALELAPAHLDARHLLMDIYYDQADFDKLSLAAGRILQIAPNDPQALFYMDLASHRKSKLAIAAENAYANKTPENFLNLSLMYYEARQFENCIEAANEAIKLKPDYAAAYNNICAAYNEMKLWDKAIEAGEKAVTISPDFQLAKNNLAWAIDHKKQSAAGSSAKTEPRN